jgi:hypothetical protein
MNLLGDKVDTVQTETFIDASKEVGHLKVAGSRPDEVNDFYQVT